LESLDAYTRQTDILALVSASRFANGLSNATTAVSGSSLNPGTEPLFFSNFQLEENGEAEPGHVLLVEDNKLDILMVQEALAEHQCAAILHVVEDGEEAIRFIDAADQDLEGPSLALILLDLNLPKRSGAEVLTHIRRSRRCINTNVLIITSSDSTEDREETRRLGANEYFLKPPSYEDFLKVGKIIRNMLHP
jgi:chemotaxis family two-component system response regulator Rcp1